MSDVQFQKCSNVSRKIHSFKGRGEGTAQGLSKYAPGIIPKCVPGRNPPLKRSMPIFGTPCLSNRSYRHFSKSDGLSCFWGFIWVELQKGELSESLDQLTQLAQLARRIFAQFFHTFTTSSQLATVATPDKNLTKFSPLTPNNTSPQATRLSSKPFRSSQTALPVYPLFHNLIR